MGNISGNRLVVTTASGAYGNNEKHTRAVQILLSPLLTQWPLRARAILEMATAIAQLFSSPWTGSI